MKNLNKFEKLIENFISQKNEKLSTEETCLLVELLLDNTEGVVSYTYDYEYFECLETLSYEVWIEDRYPTILLDINDVTNSIHVRYHDEEDEVHYDFLSSFEELEILIKNLYRDEL